MIQSTSINPKNIYKILSPTFQEFNEGLVSFHTLSATISIKTDYSFFHISREPEGSKTHQ